MPVGDAVTMANWPLKTRRRRGSVPIIAGACCAIVLTLGACGTAEPDPSTTALGGATSDRAAFPVTIKNCGLDVTVTAPPMAAITLDQGATETMLALGLESSMVGTAYLDDAVSPEWQTAYQSVPVLAKEYPDKETILGKQPDFVAASYSSAFDDKVAGSRQSLLGLGVATYLSPFGCEDRSLRPDPASWDAIFAEVTDIATIYGEPARAERLIATQKQQVETVTSAAPAKGRTVLWFDSGTKEPLVGAGAGAPQLMIEALGGTNVFAELKGTWGDGSWETVLAADPDLIVLADASWDTAKDKIAYLKGDPALKDLKAVRNDAFLTIPFSSTTAGVRNAEGLTSLAAQLAALG